MYTEVIPAPSDWPTSLQVGCLVTMPMQEQYSGDNRMIKRYEIFGTIGIVKEKQQSAKTTWNVNVPATIFSYINFY
jgi:hypothetical protein